MAEDYFTFCERVKLYNYKILNENNCIHFPTKWNCCCPLLTEVANVLSLKGGKGSRSQPMVASNFFPLYPSNCIVDSFSLKNIVKQKVNLLLNYFCQFTLGQIGPPVAALGGTAGLHLNFEVIVCWMN